MTLKSVMGLRVLNWSLKYLQKKATFKHTQVWTAINNFSIKSHQYIKQGIFTVHVLVHRYINITNFNYSLL